MKRWYALGFTIISMFTPPAIAAQDTAGAITDFLQSEMQERQVPGLQIIVIQHGKTVLSKVFGVASMQYRVPVSDNSVFSINSATKSFTGVAVMQLAQQGKIDVQAPASRYLEGLPANWRTITVTQLLNHTSGLPDILDPASSAMLASTEEAAWKAVQVLPMEFAPGERFSYNQTNYVLLQKIITKLSGQPYLQFIQRQQFDAVGMPNSSFGDSLDVISNKANSYRLGEDGKTLRNVIEDFPLYTRAGAGINSNVQDLAKWIIALQQGRLLDQASLRKLWAPTTFSDGQPAPWALGWPTIRREGHRAVAGLGGGRSAFYVYPEDDLAIVILTNLAGAQPQQLMDSVAGWYVPELKHISSGAYTLYRLRQRIAASGYGKLDQQLQQVMQQYAVARPSQNDLNNWGYRLLAKQQNKQAQSVFALALHLYPDNADAAEQLKALTPG
jgi:CubicO group peptidase (beta-lactamase class C family)